MWWISDILGEIPLLLWPHHTSHLDDDDVNVSIRVPQEISETIINDFSIIHNWMDSKFHAIFSINVVFISVSWDDDFIWIENFDFFFIWPIKKNPIQNRFSKNWDEYHFHLVRIESKIFEVYIRISLRVTNFLFMTHSHAF